MQLSGSCFIIQSHLFFNNLLNFCSHFGWSSTTWLVLDDSSALIPLQKLSNTLPTCTQTFTSQQLGYSWSFVLLLEVVEQNSLLFVLAKQHLRGRWWVSFGNTFVASFFATIWQTTPRLSVSIDLILHFTKLQ